MKAIEKKRKKVEYLIALAMSCACQDFFGVPRTHTIEYYPSDVMYDWGWRKIAEDKSIVEDEDFIKNPDLVKGIQISLNLNEITRTGVVMFSELG